MRILLLHNPKAGKKDYDTPKLLEALKDAGHKAHYRSSIKRGWKKAFKRKFDLVVVAGGDGTVGAVARKFVGKKVALSVLPLGTANNLARTLGFDQPVKKLIAKLGSGREIRFDVGVARGPWRRRLLFEGAGAGLFADYLFERKGEKKKETGSKAEQLKRHAEKLLEQLDRQPGREWQIELDGKDFSGRYLLWQAMNIRSIGPALAFATGARTNDGAFDFVGVREEDRQLLLGYLRARLAGRSEKFPVPARRFMKMRVRSIDAPIHLDDESWPAKDEELVEGGRMTITVKRGALRILKPGR